MAKIGLGLVAFILGAATAGGVLWLRLQREHATALEARERAIKEADRARLTEQQLGEMLQKEREAARLEAEMCRSLQAVLEAQPKPGEAIALPRELLKRGSLWLSDFHDWRRDGPPGVPDSVAQILALLPAERAAAEAAMRKAWEDLLALEASHATVTESAEASVVLVIGGFPEEGKALREQVLAALEKTLGKERLETWMLVQKQFPERAFHEFGQGSFTIRLARKDGGRYEATEEFTRGTSTSTRRATMTAAELVRYRHLAAHLPAALRQDVPPATPPPAVEPAGTQTRGDEIF